MKPERKRELETAGVDVDQALERMMGSDGLLERLLAKFLEDQNYSGLRAALEVGDTDRAAAAAHTLKGMCGNLSMTGLFQLFTRQVAALREGDLAGARDLMERIVPAYEAAEAAIRGDRNEGN